MSATHRAIAVFLVGGTLAVLADRFIEKPIERVEKKISEAID